MTPNLQPDFRYFVVPTVVGRVTIDPERPVDGVDSFLKVVPGRHRNLGPNSNLDLSDDSLFDAELAAVRSLGPLLHLIPVPFYRFRSAALLQKSPAPNDR